MKIIAVRIGDKYGPEYETYLENKLPEHEFIWVRESINSLIQLQWNKMVGMDLNTDEPICVIDIDIILINEYKKIFDYPIHRGQFAAMPGWWRDTDYAQYKINGGFFKYYPKDCKYIYDKFMSDPVSWQKHYIENGTTKGPVNGEQYFVEDSVREQLELVILPESWFCRMLAEDVMEDKEMYNNWLAKKNAKYSTITGNPYMYLGGDFYPDIKLVHFTHSANKPHNWTEYSNFI